MTDDEKLTVERNKLCSFVTGYLYGTLEGLQRTYGADPAMQAEISERLEYVRPVVEKIYELGKKITHERSDEHGFSRL
jgi:hypothetical protein